MADVIPFPNAGSPIRRAPSPIVALAVGVATLNDDADSFTCIAGALIMQDKLRELGFDVVRRVELPANPINGG